MKPQSREIPFKRLPSGARFLLSGNTFRKINGKSAYAILPNGKGQTHAPIPFARSTFVLTVS